MLDAIQEMAQNRPDEEKEHMAVLEYLKACNLLFESGTLSHQPIKHVSSNVLENMDKGFCYFSKWKADHSAGRLTKFLLNCVLNKFHIISEWKS